MRLHLNNYISFLPWLYVRRVPDLACEATATRAKAHVSVNQLSDLDKWQTHREMKVRMHERIGSGFVARGMFLQLRSIDGW